ncbi:16S rRNA (uracil(1498)-N(3))-methyltransferase [Mesonia maritima]|uniref:Ribosomal RNA small subunit methyltransferase E n=1 Tax=Mesonia maritima TaxID=1793873 RepID=A0ABU1K7S5_9FLAO|nr:16S rRNA (uracil(1498)-N(3))-methyltransferase [Mesonia maritima]MDR6301650.1 16S rRNA (uracil1498-N3)-methyltransferase [Mesonia maritima]
MQLFYNPSVDENDAFISFPKAESRHILKVLRKKTGDELLVTNGKGNLFSATITEISNSKCIAKVNSVKTDEKKSFSIHIAIAPTKKNDRFEWFLEKATEIGIDKITPIICDHSERKVVKLDRFERVLQSALKQSLQYTIPTIEEPLSFQEFINKKTTDSCFIAHCEEDEEKNPLKNNIELHQNYTILIGPEGDFSSEEIKTAIHKNYKPVSLGKNRLRTETAAIVACHTINLAHE